ncbi:MAG TPA: hypothetical protein PJ986_03430 [Gammaproteobacteria bacterium]|nr:hypothetical protein [Gammaproteobacteria bacterium]
MTWHLRREPADGWIVLDFEGELSRQDCVRATRETLARLDPGRAEGVLVDARQASCALGVGDIYTVPAMWEHASVHRGSALAMVVDDATAQARDLEFFENTCRNRGWNVRVFGDYDEALAWLAGQVKRSAAGKG